MPVKRKGQKARFIAPWGDRFTETELWDAAFSTGFDMLGILKLIGGVETVDLKPPLELARDAWNRLGADYLASGEPGQWALEQFGEPQ